MRILLVNKFHYRKGGAETYYLTVGSELERMGHEVAYFSMRHPDNLPCEWDKYFVTQREYNNVKNPLKAARDGMALVYSPEAKRNFQALCEEFRPDVVHLNNVHRQITLSILDAPYLRENKVPVFYTAHDYVTVCPGYLMLDGDGRVCDACLEDGRYRHCIEGRCVKGSRAKSALAAMEASFNRAHRSNRLIDRVIAPSRFMRSKLIEGGWPEGKVVFLQNFADDSILDRAANAGADATDRENPYLLFFGRLSAEKGVDTLLRAFDAALPNLPHCAWLSSATARMPPTSRRSRLRWAVRLASSSPVIRPVGHCKRMWRGRLSPSRVRDGERTCRTRSWRLSLPARLSSAQILAEFLSWSMRGKRGSFASPGMSRRWRMPSRAARARSWIGPLTRCCSATAAPTSWKTARARSS